MSYVMDIYVACLAQLLTYSNAILVEVLNTIGSNEDLAGGPCSCPSHTCRAIWCSSCIKYACNTSTATGWRIPVQSKAVDSLSLCLSCKLHPKHNVWHGPSSPIDLNLNFA